MAVEDIPLTISTRHHPLDEMGSSVGIAGLDLIQLHMLLEVAEKDVHALTFNTIVIHNNARAANNLAWVTLTIDPAQVP